MKNLRAARLRKALSILFVAMFFTQNLFFLAAADDDFTSVPAQYPISEPSGVSREDNYQRYSAENENVPLYTGLAVFVEGASCTASEKAEPRPGYLGSKLSAVYSAETGFLEWTFEVAETARYALEWDYATVQGKNTDISRELILDGNIPFYEAKNIKFSRFWEDAGKIKQDSRGNDIFPQQRESFQWAAAMTRESSGYYEEPFLFHLTKGTHTLRLASIAEPVVIGGFRLLAYEEPPSYKARLKDWSSQGFEAASGKALLFEAENALLKSSPSLYPIYDKSSSITSPSSHSKIKLNTIGGQSWQYPGDWISWEVEVPEAGLYRIALRARQNISSGFYSSRILFVNDEIPFKEAQNILFRYSSDWGLQVLGDDQNGEYWIYLKKGINTIRLESTLGQMREILLRADIALNECNILYRQILMLTGSSPDTYRDYKIEAQLPDLVSELKLQKAAFTGIKEDILAQTVKGGENVISLDRLIYCLREMIKEPEEIPAKLTDFKQNLTAIASWMIEAKKQPLEIDYLAVAPQNAELPKQKAGFLKNIAFWFMSFIASYTENYNTIGDINQETFVDVWVGSGRDQANIINRLAESDFCINSNVGVKLSLVSMSVLMPATLSGKGPDVALHLAQAEIVNFALREAAAALDDLPGYRETAAPIMESALVPFTYNGRVFGLAETQSFPLLFYRKDILKELGVTRLDTWEDIYAVIPLLQKKGFEFGLPGISSGLSSFGIFLYQNGGAFYSADAKKSALNNETANKAFEQFTEFYTNYSAPVSYDFPTRFRTGEMPLGVADYTTFALLSIFAPEIEGLWSFTPVPGTVTGEGTIDRTVPAACTGCMILSRSKKQDAAWDFVKWWMSTDTQASYATELENAMGVAARFPTANNQVIKRIAWTPEELSVIEAQWKQVRAIPEVPGGYFTSRQVEFAFRKVVVSGQRPRDVLYEYAMQIDQEIFNKRKEFRLETD